MNADTDTMRICGEGLEVGWELSGFAESESLYVIAHFQQPVCLFQYNEHLKLASTGLFFLDWRQKSLSTETENIRPS